MKQKVVAGLSGGVDSSVAAYLLKEQGYDVMGVTVRTWQGSGKDTEDAAMVAEALGIPYVVMDFSRQFQQQVIDYFVAEYRNGRTPNPCIACNRYVKWEALLACADELGAQCIATGHYACVEKLDNGRYTISNSAAASKDQTYVLYSLTQEQLSRTILPIGTYPKEEIRCIAQREGLLVADKPDSQEICFVPDNDHAGFIERQTNGKVPGPGNFVAADGTVLGRHKGVTHYTVGQRKGLGLPMGRRVFVTRIKPETNEVVIGEETDIFVDRVRCDRVNYMSVADLEKPRRVFAKVRYNHKGEYCLIEKMGDGSVLCTFDRPVRTSAPGQAVVFYEDGHVLGGGTIL